jgi:GT2 family glycosyltransferase
MKSVSIVIPNWNGLELLTEHFGSVIAAAEEYRSRANAEVEVIIVDDASTDRSRDWLLKSYGEHELIKVVELECNVGFLQAVNEGFTVAKHDVVLLLNNDVKVEPDCIAPLVKHFKDEVVFATCCRADRIDGGRLDGGGKIGRFERGFWRVFLNYEAIPFEATTELISFFGAAATRCMTETSGIRSLVFRTAFRRIIGRTSRSAIGPGSAAGPSFMSRHHKFTI